MEETNGDEETQERPGKSLSTPMRQSENRSTFWSTQYTLDQAGDDLRPIKSQNENVVTCISGKSRYLLRITGQGI